jgi:hypothetical protein
MKPAKKIRVRHYTRKNSADKIMKEGVIRAWTQNRVFASLTDAFGLRFVEKATRKPLSPRNAEQKYGLLLGKGKSVIEFDVCTTELKSKPNPGIKPGREFYLDGDVDLTNRNPERVR